MSRLLEVYTDKGDLFAFDPRYKTVVSLGAIEHDRWQTTLKVKEDGDAFEYFSELPPERVSFLLQAAEW